MLYRLFVKQVDINYQNEIYLLIFPSIALVAINKPLEIIKNHQHHRHHTEIIAICNSHACQQDALKYDLNFSYYIELKGKIESDNKDVLDKLSYKKRLALIELLSD